MLVIFEIGLKAIPSHSFSQQQLFRFIKKPIDPPASAAAGENGVLR